MRKIYIVNININGGNIVENNMAIEYPMFCYQCEQTAGGKGCTKMGVCGKTPEVAALQDLLIYQIKGISCYAKEIVEKGENVDIYISLPEKKLVMDRTKSGIVDFGKDSAPHAIEAHDRRKQNSINYVDDFALGTWAPVQKAGNYKLDIFVDKCSVEIFLNGGKIAMTNLIFPTTPYNQMSFYSRGGAFKVDRCKIYRL